MVTAAPRAPVTTPSVTSKVTSRSSVVTSATSGIVKSGRKKFEYVQESGKDNDEKLGKWQQQLKQRLGRPPNPEVTIGGSSFLFCLIYISLHLFAPCLVGYCMFVMNFDICNLDTTVHT